MNNFLRGMGRIFNLFPQTDYMAMVPEEGELFEQSAKDVGHSLNDAYIQLAGEYGYTPRSSQANRIAIKKG